MIRTPSGHGVKPAGCRPHDVARFEEAVPILREAIAVQKKINAVPDIAFTQDSLCDVLVDLGAARKQSAMAQEAIAACQDALVIFKDRKMDDLTAGSEKTSPRHKPCWPRCGKAREITAGRWFRWQTGTVPCYSDLNQKQWTFLHDQCRLDRACP
jgi:hypothetical protein